MTRLGDSPDPVGGRRLDSPNLESRCAMSRLAPSAAAVVAATLLAVAAAGSATAKPIDRGTIHEEVDLFLTDFCDATGLDVDFHSDVVFEYALRSRGKDQLIYGSQKITGTSTWTNPDNGRVVTENFHVREKDLKVTDNGDGTYTLLILGTGNSTYTGTDGKAIARNPGQSRWEILIDYNGTPGDPFDDEFLEYLGEVKASTGRTDDFCAAAVAELT
jgi:hypothetical protein